MNAALAHPQHGYYMKQDPFGAAGDFTTAPEISQMFGEMIGAWAADLWLQMGSPNPMMLLECGPGRGTLMSDLMRATRNVSGFHESVQIHMLEISPVLKGTQVESLGAYGVQHHDSMQSVAQLGNSMPKIIIANEFFDALPIRQIRKSREGWEEKMLGIGNDSKLNWQFQNVNFDINSFFKDLNQPIENNSIFELSSIRLSVMRQILDLISEEGGAALVIDYGHFKTSFGDTLQALYKHSYCDVLDHLGDADITAHVDFEQFIMTCHDAAYADVKTHGPVTQETFLKTLGVGLRAAQLSQSASETQKKDIEIALNRLIDPDQMGELFKVLSFTNGGVHGKNLKPAGFSG